MFPQNTQQFFFLKARQGCKNLSAEQTLKGTAITQTQPFSEAHTWCMCYRILHLFGFQGNLHENNKNEGLLKM